MDQRFSLTLDKPSDDNRTNPKPSYIPVTNSISTFHESEQPGPSNHSNQPDQRQPSRNFSFSSDKKDLDSSSSQEDEGPGVLAKMNKLNEDHRRRPTHKHPGADQGRREGEDT